jgi:hypothetical protein
LDLNTIGIILGSSVLASFVTAIFTKRAHEEAVALKYITEERAKWREKIKQLMVNMNDAINSSMSSDTKLARVRRASTYLKLSLNPDPKHKIDNTILDILEELCIDTSYEKFLNLEAQVSLLLKHDWERAKSEATVPLSSFVLFSIMVGLVWCAFYFIISGTSIFELIKQTPYIAGSYSEIALSLILVSISIPLLSYFRKAMKGELLKRKINQLTNN